MLLASGRVLITGGWDTSYYVDSSQSLIFDPATNALTPGPLLVAGRDAHASVRLADGRVLVVGGRQASSYLSLAEIYDPVAAKFTLAPSMGVARMSPSATLLLDGRVLVAGGNASGPDAEVFDPATGAWTATGPLAVPRQGQSAIRLPDGRVVILGGYPRTGSSLTAKVEVFDPSTLTFSPGESLPSGRRNEASLLLDDGRILIAGGVVEGNNASSSVLYYAPECTPTSCAAVGAQCGTIPDGCNNTLSCGTCGAGQLCTQNQCVACQPTTCATAGASCGWISNGCGDWVSCGACGAGQICTANQCVACQPATCATYGATCGSIGDGCGGWLDCGTCAGNTYCQSYQCVCAPAACPAEPGTCGPMPDGCGGTLECGGCAAGEECVANACVAGGGSAAYDPALGAPTCAALGPTCSSGSLLVGRGPVGPEPSAPNTIDGCLDGTSGAFHGDESLDALRLQTLDGTELAPGKAVRLEADAWVWGSGDFLDVYLAPDAAAPQWSLVTTLTPPGAGLQTLSAEFTLPYGGPLQAVRGVFRYGEPASPCPGGGFDDADDLVFHVAVVTPPTDVTPPEVTLLTPADGELLGAGPRTVEAMAVDDVGVVQVELYLDGFLLGSAAAPPYTAALDASWFVDGTHLVEAVAYDAAGNNRVSLVQVVTDGTKPTVSITSPAAGAAVSGTVLITASASDQNGISRVEFYDGAQHVGTATTSPWTASWNTSAATAGSHALTARAVDQAGNVGTSAPVTVTVSGPPPSGAAVYDAARRAPACASPGSTCDSGTLLNGRSARLGPEPNASNAINGSCSDGTAGTYHADESIDRLRVSTTDGTPFAAGKTVRVEATVWVWGASSDRLDVWYAADAASPQWVLAGTVTPTAGGLQVLARTFTLPAGARQAVRAVFRYGGAAAPCVSGSFNDVDDLVFAVQ